MSKALKYLDNPSSQPSTLNDKRIELAAHLENQTRKRKVAGFALVAIACGVVGLAFGL